MDSHNKRLVDAVRKGDNLVIRQLYLDYYQYATKFVITNNGTKDDAMECFQEALVVFFRATCDEDFCLKANVKHYLAAVVKNLWLKELRRKKKSQKVLTSLDLTRSNLEEIEYFDEVEFEKVKLDENYRKLSTALNNIGADCHTLLNYTFFDKKKDKEIAPLMNYKLDFVRQKRKRCLAKLKEIINEL